MTSTHTRRPELTSAEWDARRRLVRFRVDNGVWEDASFDPNTTQQEIAEIVAKVRGPLTDGVVLVRLWNLSSSPTVTHWSVTMSGADATAEQVK